MAIEFIALVLVSCYSCTCFFMFGLSSRGLKLEEEEEEEMGGNGFLLLVFPGQAQYSTKRATLEC